MLTLTSVLNPQPDYVALAMVLVLLIIVAVMAIRKRFAAKKPVTVEAPVPAEAPEQPVAPGAAGQVKLHDVEPKKAAMLMAIVADKMGKPLNELRFISIKEVK
jgi:3-oxoacyl-ACP reductase-like protein